MKKGVAAMMHRFITAFAVCAVFGFAPAVYAEGLRLRVFLPQFGEVFIGDVGIEIVSPVLKKREADPEALSRGERGVCGDYKREECEAIFLRQWLRVIPERPPRISIAVREVIAPTAYVSDYSLFISRGGTLFAETKPIRFSYYTINADAIEAANIEKHRARLDAMARQKKKILISGIISRIETSDLALFQEGKTKTEFLDFYLSDIRFEFEQ